jgi:uncharacterized protein YqjF (DUF2071 family)
MCMTWRDLLFAHWPVPPEALLHRVPATLELDTFDGDAWLGVVPFLMDDVQLRWLPPLPGAGRFPELNVRTYVRSGDRAGVWFFSLDAASRLTERYCLFARDRRGKLRVGEIHHEPWVLQRAAAEIRTNTMADPLDVELKGEPLLHFVRRLDVLAWSPVPLERG